jgi:hypothetical protein
MFDYVLILTALVVLTQAKAIVTNHCPYNVYIWSVPQVLSSSQTDNVPIKPRGQYQEPWRHGSSTNPGIAIKISPQANGVHNFADEIDFAYSIDPVDKSKVWVDLSTVRGVSFKNNLTFHTCNAQQDSTDVHVHACDATDDVELVLCDTSRTTAAKDITPLDQIQACYDYHHVCGEPGYPSCPTDDESDGDDSDGDDSESEEGSQVPVSQLLTDPAKVYYTVAIPTSGLPPKSTSTLLTPPRDTPLALSPCLAKVIYPARRAARKPQASRGTSSTRIARQQLPSLCNIMEKYHPGTCDEAAMRSVAREVYPEICNAEHGPLLMGAACEDVRDELRRAYPEAAKASEPSFQQPSDCECDACTFCAHFNDSCFCADEAISQARRELTLEVRQASSTADDGDDEPFFERFCLTDVCEPLYPDVPCDALYNAVQVVFDLYGYNINDFVAMPDEQECADHLPRTVLGGAPDLWSAFCY